MATGGEQQGWEEGGIGEGYNGEGGNGEGKMGRGERGKRGVGRERRRGKRRGDFIDGYDGMPGWAWAIGLINGGKQIECLGRQRLSCSLIATSTWNAWVE